MELQGRHDYRSRVLVVARIVDVLQAKRRIKFSPNMQRVISFESNPYLIVVWSGCAVISGLRVRPEPHQKSHRAGGERPARPQRRWCLRGCPPASLPRPRCHQQPHGRDDRRPHPRPHASQFRKRLPTMSSTSSALTSNRVEESRLSRAFSISSLHQDRGGGNQRTRRSALSEKSINSRPV